MRKTSTVVGDEQSALAAAKYPLDVASSPRALGRGDYWIKPDPALGEQAQRSHSVWVGSDAALAKVGVTRGDAVTVEQLSRVMLGKNVDGTEQIRQPGTRTKKTAGKGPAKEKAANRGKGAKGNKPSNGPGAKNGEPLDKRPVGKKGRKKGTKEPETEEVVSLVDMTFSIPKSVSVFYAMSSPEVRAQIEQVLLEAANAAIAHMVQTKNVIVSHGADRRKTYATAQGFAASLSLHLTARRAEGREVPDPQLHLHGILALVEDAQGRFKAPELSAMFRKDAALEGGAVFRLGSSHGLTMMGLEQILETGKKERAFELKVVPAGAREEASSRTNQINALIEQEEMLTGRPMAGVEAAAVGARSRQSKDTHVTPEQMWRIWRNQYARFGFGPEQAAAALKEPGYQQTLEERQAEATESFKRHMLQYGPTVTHGMAKAIAFHVATGRMSLPDAYDFQQELERSGTLVALEGERATVMNIRELEEYVFEQAERAGREQGPGLSRAAIDAGIAAAEARIGAPLDPEQREAVELLSGPAKWGILTGRAGTGKTPALDAIIAAHRAEGWNVISTAMENLLANQLGRDTGTEAISLEALKRRAQQESIAIDGKTLILVDEATKVGLAHAAELAELYERLGAKVVAVGHQSQHEAIQSPGMFKAWLESPAIPQKELEIIRRHKGQGAWIAELQVAIDDRDAAEAVRLLEERGALTVAATKEDAYAETVAQWWDQLSRYEIDRTLMLVAGTNQDADTLNVLAQRRLLEARRQEGQDVGPGIDAVDRDYKLHVGDLVVLSNTAYRFGDASASDTPQRVQNGQRGVVTEVNAERDWMEVQLDEAGVTDQRTVRIYLGGLRASWAAQQELPPRERDRVPAFRLSYAMHSFPVQGKNLDASVSFEGSALESLEAAYVLNSRARYEHRVVLDGSSLGLENDRAEQIRIWTERIQRRMNQSASIAYKRDASATITVAMPDFDAAPQWPLVETVVPEEAKAKGGWERHPMEPDPIDPEAFAPEVRLDAEGNLVEVPGPDVRMPEPALGGNGSIADLAANARETLFASPDRLERFAPFLGPERTELIRARMEQLVGEYASMDADALRAELDAHEQGVQGYDARDASETAKAEKAHALAIAAEAAALARAKALRAEAATKRRQEARDLEQEAVVQDAEAVRERREADWAIRDLSTLRLQGRHFQTWLESEHDDGMMHGEHIARWAATEREVRTRIFVLAELAAEQARDQPPERVVEALGELSADAPPKLRVEYADLAADVEREYATLDLAERYRFGEIDRDFEDIDVLVERVNDMREQQGLERRPIGSFDLYPAYGYTRDAGADRGADVRGPGAGRDEGSGVDI